MAEVLKAVAYARYSSDLQREESIEAQVRAIKDFAENSGFALQKVYADRGVSGTTDNRPQFQAMIEDAKKGRFDAIIVHKFDRFARNRADSAIYRRELERSGIKLISVLENFDDSPESIILQSVIEGYNEYYSMNLRREVMKGLKENALSCRHTGGTPCLGYDVDKNTMKLVINEWEAEAVKLIFKRYLEGEGYTSIINELNSKGFKTKRGTDFRKNSLYEILRNEKYAGVFIYNKSAAKGSNGKYNRHSFKDDEEIIRIEGGAPQIISHEDFQMAQSKMMQRKKKVASFKAKQEYLLSGKIVCGECGSTYAGNSRKASATHPLYISYRCTRKNGSLKCKNPEIQRDTLENIVLQRLANVVFDEKMIPRILDSYNAFAIEKNTELVSSIKAIEAKLTETERGIANIVNIMVQTGSAALADKLKELESTKATLENSLSDEQQKLSDMKINKRQLTDAFRKAKQMLKSGILKNRKAIIDQYVNKVEVFKDKIIITFNISSSYTIKQEVARN